MCDIDLIRRTYSNTQNAPEGVTYLNDAATGESVRARLGPHDSVQQAENAPGDQP